MHNRVIHVLEEPLTKMGEAAARVFADAGQSSTARHLVACSLRWTRQHRGWLVLAAGFLALGWGIRAMRRKRSRRAHWGTEAPQARHGMVPARQ